MTITAQQISNSMGVLLLDTDATRWTTAERLTWINNIRRQMAEKKPEIFGNGTEVTHTLTTGPKQRITASNAYRIVSIDSNVTSGKAIRPTARLPLDAFKPDWRNDTGVNVQNWFPDETDPLSFWVYPASTGTLKAHVHITPADLVSLSDTALPFDQYEPILLNGCMYLAYSKEDEAGSAAKAQAYFQLFTTALGG